MPGEHNFAALSPCICHVDWVWFFFGKYPSTLIYFFVKIPFQPLPGTPERNIEESPMTSYVVLATNSMCGPITIKASSADQAAQLYSENCDAGDSSIWVWKLEDYNSDPSMRPDPMEFDLKNAANS